jgi:hypothetical protein
VVYIYLERVRVWVGGLVGRRKVSELEAAHSSGGPVSSVSGD